MAAPVEVKVQHGGKKGWLFKWTNYIKGYRRRWFVLSDGILSYYRSPGEMSGVCRGNIFLHGALIYSVDACTFVVSNEGTQTFYIKAATEVERQQWVTVLELAKAKAIQAMESEEDEEDYQDNDNQKRENSLMLMDLTEKLNRLQTANDILMKKGTMLQQVVSDIESFESSFPDLLPIIKVFSDVTMQIRIAANNTTTASKEYLQVAKQQEPKWRKMLQREPKWKKMLQHERDQKVRIEKMVEQLAQQHSHLEEAAQHALPPPAQGGVHRPSREFLLVTYS